MDPVVDLRLQWVPVVDADASGCDHDDGHIDCVRGITAHDLRNAVTAVSAAARLLHERWDDLDEPKRKELTAIILRRSDELRLLARPEGVV